MSKSQSKWCVQHSAYDQLPGAVCSVSGRRVISLAAACRHEKAKKSPARQRIAQLERELSEAKAIAVQAKVARKSKP